MKTDQRFPASFAQERHWFLDALNPDNPAYNVAFTVGIRGNINIDRLLYSIEVLFRRHRQFHCRFFSQNGKLLQQPVDDLELRVDVHAETPADPAADSMSPQELLTQLAKTPFDLSTAPLIRMQLVRVSATEVRLLVVVHHIIFDGWSAGIFLRELAAVYQDREDLLPDNPIDFFDYSIWQHSAEYQQFVSDRLDFWKQYLAAAPTQLQLPADYPRPANQSFVAQRFEFSLSAELDALVHSAAVKFNMTPFLVVLSAFQALIYRYTGRHDFLIGTPVAARTHQEIENLIGCFINTLPVRIDLSGNPTFRELTNRSCASFLPALEHQDVPLERIMEVVKVERDLGYAPLLQVMFLFQNAVPGRTTVAGNLEFWQEKQFTGTTQFDLTLEMWQGDNTLRGHLEYRPDLFSESRIKAMWHHLQTLLSDGLTFPNKPLSELQLLPESGQWQIETFSWGPIVDNKARESLADIVASGLDKFQDKVLLEFEGRQFSGKEIACQSAKLAMFLQSSGIGKGDRVGIYLTRSPGMVFALLAIVRIGATYVPLDPDFPGDRLRYMVSHGKVSAIICDQPLPKDLAGPAVKIVHIDDAAQSDHKKLQSVDIAAEDVAYIIYTSGSTGRPKGVAIPHRAVVNFLHSMAQQPGLTENDRFLAITTLSFDISILEIFLPLIRGALLRILPQDTVRNGFLLAEVLDQWQPTVMQATPSTWRLLLEGSWQGSSRLVALCGGEALTVDLAEKLFPAVGELWNLYGPTETTVWSAIKKIENPRQKITVGRPIINTVCRILDDQRQIVPTGIPGELWIGGQGVASGYWQQPDLSAERFIEDPFAENGRLYRTGDQAYWDQSGEIVIMGRVDHQLKIRGFRIEPGEIEAVLNQHPLVDQAVVVAMGDNEDNRWLAAYVVAAAQEVVDAPELKQHLANQLPSYMVPANIFRLDEMPLTPNGKIDRKSLPGPETLRARKNEAAVESETEKLIGEAWREALRVPDIGRTDNFFDLGGHSLLAMKVIAAIESKTGVRLSPQMLVSMSLMQLAKICENEAQHLPDAPAETANGRWVGKLKKIIGI